MHNFFKMKFPGLPIMVVGCSLCMQCQSIQNEKKEHVTEGDTSNFMMTNWEIDPECVLPRGEGFSIDSRVAGDPCIVWDEDINAWRMFYFGGGLDSIGRYTTTGIATSRSAEAIGPGDWTKQGEINIANPEDLVDPRRQHKWWVVMEAKKLNTAAKINDRYWSIFTCNLEGRKHIQGAWADQLAGPWTILKQPLLSPDGDFMDGRHCDTPTAYWFADRDSVAIFYKAYPAKAQKKQPGAEFGSGTVLAFWHPNAPEARKVRVLQRPGQSDDWNQGWISTPQIFYHEKTKSWYGLINGSPTPPEDESHREPAPSLGGWVQSTGDWINAEWEPVSEYSPFRYPEDLNPHELEAGLGVNFWRHHMLVTPEGQARIYFNSGQYGTEQMYSLVRK